MKQAVIILAHGSRDAGARAEYRRLVESISARLHRVAVQFGVLEFPDDDFPSIAAAVERCARTGAERLVVLPFFLFAAGHVREDVPGQLAEAATAWPGLAIAYQPPLGVEPRLLDALESRAVEVAAQFPTPVAGPTALLLLGAGTSDPDANADLYRAARLLWERRRFDLVEVGFVSLTEPDVAEAVRRCRTLGAARVVVVPYFLNTGRLSRRIAARPEACRQEFPGFEIALAGEIGLHPSVLDLAGERIERALASPESNGLALPPCAVTFAAWACWLEQQRAPQTPSPRGRGLG